jgi:mono/diheme cytochrome c family protein
VSRPRPGAAGRGDEATPADVERLHRAIAREPRDPIEGREPAPWWIWATTVAAIFWGGFYLGRYAPSFGVRTHEAFGARADEAPAALPGPELARAGEPPADGAGVYAMRCQTCHQAGGKGLPPSFPPLAGSRWVQGPPEIPIRIVLHGLQGPIEVEGATYQGVMPPWGAILSDAEIAAVVTHERGFEGNVAGSVDAALVAQVRAQPRAAPWTAAELESAARAAAAPAEPAP